MPLSQRAKLAILVLVTAALAVLVLSHQHGLNGPAYWQWPWRRAVNPPPTAYLILLLAACPTFIAMLRFGKSHGRGAALAILLMMGACAALQAASRGLDMNPFDFTRVAAIIEEPGSNGYFTHAEQFVNSGESLHHYLGAYARLMHGFSLHARNKPPGSILFFVPFLKWASTENSAALAAGLAIALLATLSVPATYFLVLDFTADASAALCAAACMSLTPGLVLFLPEFDQLYPVLAVGLILLWRRAVNTGRLRFALAFGLLLALVCFQTFNLLVLGVIFIGLLFFRGARPLPVIGRQCAAAVIAFALVYALLWLWSGYGPVRTLIAGVHNHQEDMPATHRLWPQTIPFDLTDFALGLGWVPVLLAGFYVFTQRRFTGIIILCLIQPLAVAISGQLQGETARVWIFMMPLALLPAGLELARWPKWPRLAALACLWLLTAVLSQNMVFV